MRELSLMLYIFIISVEMSSCLMIIAVMYQGLWSNGLRRWMNCLRSIGATGLWRAEGGGNWVAENILWYSIRFEAKD